MPPRKMPVRRKAKAAKPPARRSPEDEGARHFRSGEARGARPIDVRQPTGAARRLGSLVAGTDSGQSAGGVLGGLREPFERTARQQAQAPGESLARSPGSYRSSTPAHYSAASSEVEGARPLNASWLPDCGPKEITASVVSRMIVPIIVENRRPVAVRGVLLVVEHHGFLLPTACPQIPTSNASLVNAAWHGDRGGYQHADR